MKKLLVIECGFTLSAEAMQRMSEATAEIRRQTDYAVLLLGAGMRVVNPESLSAVDKAAIVNQLELTGFVDGVLAGGSHEQAN